MYIPVNNQELYTPAFMRLQWDMQTCYIYIYIYIY